MSAILQIIERGRGKVLLASGWQYYKHVLYKNGISLWRCKEFKTVLKCAGSVVLNSDQTSIIKRKLHKENCEPHETHNVIDFQIEEACQKAAQGKEPAPRVYKRSLVHMTNQGLDLAAKKGIPPFKSKQGRIYRLRKKIEEVKKITTDDLDEVEVPKQFEDFLLADFKEDNNRILVFCSSEGKKHMENCKSFFMDGTFKFCPKPFTRMFTIHADIGSDNNFTNIVPLIYAFMTNRKKESYTVLFELIKSQIPLWNPIKIMIDFEEATIKALLSLSAAIVIKGCHYHYTNRLFRKATALGLISESKKKNSCRINKRIISICGNLAFLPHNEIKNGWQYIQNEMPVNDAFNKFRKYFNTYWMKSDLQKLWCVYGEMHRTNNVLEGWHHSINKRVNKNETNLLQLLHILYDDATLMKYRTNLLKKHGQSSQPKRRRMAQDRDDFITETQMQLLAGEISVGHFLDKLQ